MTMDAALTEDLKRLFIDKLRSHDKLDFSKGENLKVLSGLSIDPRGPDFEAQRLNKTHEAIRSSKDVSELNKNLKGGGGSVGYEPFTASANFSSNEEVNRAIKETFDSDWTGNDWSTVPKTVRVYQLNGADFAGSTVIRQVAVKPSFSMQVLSANPAQSYEMVNTLRDAVGASYREGFVLAPVGTVVAFVGDWQALTPKPENWQICDGSPLKKGDFPRLWEVVKTAHGDGRDPNTGNKLPEYDLNLPDFRGMFLRGVDGGAGRDDIAGRVRSVAQGNAGGLVGSIQADALQEHKHLDGGHSHRTDFVYKDAFSCGDRCGAFVGQGGGPRTTSTGDSANIGGPVDMAGGNGVRYARETRPMNVSVNWLIRVQ